jgi:hypothetical protein
MAFRFWESWWWPYRRWGGSRIAAAINLGKMGSLGGEHLRLAVGPLFYHQMRMIIDDLGPLF